MGHLSIQLFGRMEVRRDGRSLPGLGEHKAGNLLAMLLLNRQRPQARDLLAEQLWSDLGQNTGKKRLRTALWRLRRVLGQSPNDRASYITATKESIVFNVESDYWLDVEEFELAFQSIPGETRDQRIARIQQATKLYRGQLLEGIYDDWCVFERDRLERLLIMMLSEIMAYYADSRQYDQAILWGKVILNYDPVHEQVHREIMRLQHLAGRRAAAVQQYLTCRRLLEQDLGIEPMHETTSLYEQILHEGAIFGTESALDASTLGRSRGSKSTHAHPPSDDLTEVLQGALDRLLEASSEVRDVIEQLGRRTGKAEDAKRPRPEFQPDPDAPIWLPSPPYDRLQ